MYRLSVCALVLVASYGSAGAEGTRYPRTQPTPGAATLSDRVKPAPAAAAGGNAGAMTANPVPSTDVATLLAQETPIGATRPEQEQILAQLIQSTADSEVEEKADYYFRLAQIYTDEVRRMDAKSREHNARLTGPGSATLTANERSQLQAAERKASELMKNNLLKAVKAYKGLTDNEAFRNYPKQDIALFQYGYTLQLGRYMKEARAVYDKLLKHYPNSQYVPYAHLVFAEYYYDAGQLADAEARYKQVMKFPKSSAYAYATYKLGWVHYQLARYQEALELFFQVVSQTRNDTKHKALYEAARKDFVYAYAQIGKVDKIYDVLRRVDPSADASVVADLVVVLADTARTRGDNERVIGAYRQLVEKTPNDARACQWQYRVAHSSISSPTLKTDDKVREIETLVAVHVRQRAVATAQQAVEDTECRDNAMAMSRELAVAYHWEWSKTRNLDTLGYAERLYTAYVSAFPGVVPEKASLAEVLWARADAETNAKQRKVRWERAALAFASVPLAPASANANGADGGRANRELERAAALAWLNAIDFTAPTTATGSKAAIPKVAKRTGSAPTALQMNTRDEAMVAAMTAYLDAFTATVVPAEELRATLDERAAIALALATTLRAYRRFDQATDVLDRFLSQHDKHASAEYAAILLLDSLAQARSADLDVVVTGMLADRGFVDTKPRLLSTLQRLRPRI